MSKAKLIVIFSTIFLISGCAANTYFVEVKQNTTPGTTKDGTTCKASGTGNGSNVFVISFEASPISTTKDQKSTGEIPIGYNGGTASSGNSKLKDVVSKLVPNLTQSEEQTTSSKEPLDTPAVPTVGTTVEEVE